MIVERHTGWPSEPATFRTIDFAAPDKIAGMSASLDLVNVNAIGVHLKFGGMTFDSFTKRLGWTDHDLGKALLFV